MKKLATVALVLACAMTHATPVNTLPLMLTIRQEYPAIAYRTMSTQATASLCVDVSQSVSTTHGLRLMGRTKAQHDASTDDMLLHDKLTAKQARIEQAVTAYVYSQPAKASASMDDTINAARVLGEETLVACRLALEH